MIIKAFPGSVRAVFLHAVSGTQQPAPVPDDTEYNGVPVRYFRTYPTAAAKAVRLGLLGAVGARRVLEATEADMAADRANVGAGSANEAILLEELAQARDRLGLWSIAADSGPARPALPGLGQLPGLGLGRRLFRRVIGGTPEGDEDAQR